MDLQWLKDLRNLARTGNFSQAAALNNVSQSAFSRRIQSLEQWVGAALVDRSRHPVKLTDAGKQILEAGEQAITRIETARDFIRESMSQPDKYVVTFAAQHSIGWRFYPAWLQEFEQSFGPIISRLLADNLPNCVKALEQGEADFVVSYQSEYDRGIADRIDLNDLVIGRDRLLPVAKANAAGEPIFSIEAGTSGVVPYLRFGPDAPIGGHIDAVIGGSGLMDRLTPVYENSMGVALRIRARDGLGIAWLPYSLVEPDIDAGLLTQAGPDELTIDLDIKLHRLRRNENRLVDEIWTYLKGRGGKPLL